MNDVELLFYAEKLKKNKIKITPQRTAILKYFLSIESPTSADELFRNIKPDFPSINKTTIENNLEMLDKLKVIKKLKHNNKYPKYEILTLPVYSCELICIKCGLAFDLNEEGTDIHTQFSNVIAGFTSLNISMKIQGVCADCQNKKII